MLWRFTLVNTPRDSHSLRMRTSRRSCVSFDLLSRHSASRARGSLICVLCLPRRQGGPSRRLGGKAWAAKEHRESGEAGQCPDRRARPCAIRYLNNTLGRAAGGRAVVFLQRARTRTTFSSHYYGFKESNMSTKNQVQYTGYVT